MRDDSKAKKWNHKIVCCHSSHQASSFLQMIEMWQKGIFFKDNKKVRLSLDFFSDGNLCFDFIVWGPLFWLGRPNFQTRPPIDMFTNQASWKVLSMVLDTRKKPKSVVLFLSKKKLKKKVWKSQKKPSFESLMKKISLFSRKN